MIRLATVGKWSIVKMADGIFHADLPYGLSPVGANWSSYGCKTHLEAWLLAMTGRQVWLVQRFPNKEAWRVHCKARSDAILGIVSEDSLTTEGET